jgi:hypothetical protein
LQATPKVTVEVVVANAGDVTASHSVIRATLRAVAEPSSSKKSPSTTRALPATQSASTTVALLPAGGSLDVSLPALKVLAAGRYVLTVTFGGESEIVTLQVA